MKIAIYHNLPSGGAKRTLYEAVKRLVGKHHIDVYTLSCANHEFADLRPFIESYQIFDFKPGHQFGSPFGRLNQAVRLIDLFRLQAINRLITRNIERAGCDLVFVQPSQFENSPSILGKIRGIPTVFYCHEPLRYLYETSPQRPYDQLEIKHRRMLNKVDPLPALYKSVLKNVDRRNIKKSSLVLVNSEFSRQAVNKIYNVDAKVSYHGVDTQHFLPKTTEKQHMVISVGSLTPLKGFDFLIQMISEFPLERRPVFKIASNFQNPPEREYLQSLADDMKVRLELVGNISDEQLVELYNQAIVTVYAPIREPFGLVPLESMACGTPVVAVSEGGIQETVIHGVTGYQVERNAKSFAAAVDVLLTNPTKAAEFGSNGRMQVLQRWTWEKAIESLESHLQDVATKGEMHH
jgi:glycosyltransferase involved in cell wall biosynthesis